MSDVSASFFDPANAAAVGDEISQMAAEHGVEPALVIIDTMSTNFGPGDESKNTDVAALLSNVNVNVGGRFHCAVIISHHVGHGDKDRERGAYAIRGNADARVLVQRTGDELGTALHCLKVKDGQEWAPIAFKGRVITIPGITDSEGEAATSLCLERVEYVPPAR